MDWEVLRYALLVAEQGSASRYVLVYRPSKLTGKHVRDVHQCASVPVNPDPRVKVRA